MDKNLFDDVPLECYWGDDWDFLSARKAYERAKTSELCWIALLDVYFWHYQGKIGYNEDVSSVAGKTQVQFAYRVHTNLSQPYTIHEAERELRGKPDLPLATFRAWPCRFHNIFRKSFHGCPLPDLFRLMVPVSLPSNHRNLTIEAYKMKTDVDWFVIAGVDPESEHAKKHFPWSLYFQDLYKDVQSQE